MSENGSRTAHLAARLRELERQIAAASTEETDPRDPKVRRENELREQHNALLQEWKNL